LKDSLLQFKYDLYGGAKADNAFKNFKYYNGIMVINLPPMSLSLGWETGNLLA